MCRNIVPLFHVDPPASDQDAREAALQYVRKISGYQKPSRANEAAFQAAVDAVTAATVQLLEALETKAPTRPRVKAPRSNHQEV